MSVALYSKRVETWRWRNSPLDAFGWISVGLELIFIVSLPVAPGTMTRGSILATLPFAGILAIVARRQTLVIR